MPLGLLHLQYVLYIFMNDILIRLVFPFSPLFLFFPGCSQGFSRMKKKITQEPFQTTVESEVYRIDYKPFYYYFNFKFWLLSSFLNKGNPLEFESHEYQNNESDIAAMVILLS